MIVGGESGPKSRRLDPEWVRSLHVQCVSQKIPFFFKQWGGTQKKEAGRELDGKTYDEMPERSVIQQPSKVRRDEYLQAAKSMTLKWTERLKPPPEAKAPEATGSSSIAAYTMSLPVVEES